MSLALIVDTSALVPCSEKDEEHKKCIFLLDKLLAEGSLERKIVMYLTQDVLAEYVSTFWRLWKDTSCRTRAVHALLQRKPYFMRVRPCNRFNVVKNLVAHKLSLEDDEKSKSLARMLFDKLWLSDSYDLKLLECLVSTCRRLSGVTIALVTCDRKLLRSAETIKEELTRSLGSDKNVDVMVLDPCQALELVTKVTRSL